MPLNNITTPLVLDVYDYDLTPSSVKSIACDDNTRFVTAELTCRGEPYYIPENSAVELTVLRPDKTGVGIVGQTYPYAIWVTPEGEESDPVEQTVYGVSAELDRPAIDISGILYGQFKIGVGEQTLRTEIFKINNGKALDAETPDWSGSYQFYNLDEFSRRINDLIVVDGSTIRITTSSYE